MNEFEQQLKEQLRRVPAPAGLANHILTHVAHKRRQRRMGTWAAVVLVLAGVISGLTMFQQHRDQREQAQLARRQFEVAMRITTGALRDISEQVIQPSLQISGGNQ